MSRIQKSVTLWLSILAFTNFFAVNTHAEDFTSVDNGEYVGYLRVGAGVAAGGGPQNCYYLGNGDGHGYRLGNECDSYTEIGYARTFAKADDGTRFVGHIMISDYSGNSAYSGNVDIAQIFVDAQGLDWLHGGTVWLGERFYERPDIHWLDLQYINLNGTGAGFDNIPTGFLNSKFSYAIFKDSDTDNFSADPTVVPNTVPNAGANELSSNSAVRNNLLLRGISTGTDGTLDIVLGLLTPSTPSNDRHTGYYLNAFHKQEAFGGGNLLGVQYGVGSGTGRGAPLTFNSALPNAAFGNTGGIGPDSPCCNRIGQAGSTLLGSSDTRLRVFDAIWIQPTKEFGMAFDALYQGDKSPVYGGTSNWMSVGVRPEYAFFTHFKLQGEIGIDRVTYPGATAENLLKFTVAPTITLGQGFFDRPELRFFVTHANWNQAATAVINSNNNSTNGSNSSLASVTSNTSVGFQLEAWWGKNWF
jgi:maltoporin